MTCYSAKRQSTAFLDKRLRAREYSRVAAHLNECSSCAMYFEQVGSLRSGLKALPGIAAPDRLHTALRVIASRERQAVVESRGSRWKHNWERWKFRLRLLLEPVTIPATGGILSSLILFGSLALALDATATQNGSYDYEVPVVNVDDITANLVPIELHSKEVVLTMNLDGDGHIRDYAVQDGARSFVGTSARLQYNNISLPDFQGILTFAHPTTSDISIQLLPLAFRR